MNHVYRLLWNDATLSFTVVAENVKSRGKRSGGGKAAVALAGALLAGAALAQAPLPGGAQVASGQATVSTAGTTMTVNQGSEKAVINWDSFSIGKGATVNFVQPSSSALVLNRVVGNEGSVIDGALNANGQVFLLNSNGVLFNRGASVNTAGLVASTMALGDDDFNAGRYRFGNNGSTASVINFGNIQVADGGYAALLGRQVRNEGTIVARLGTVALAAGDKVSLNFSGNSLLNVTVDQGVLDALVENRSAILADGGQVVLTARAVDALMATVVNNTGEIRARTVENRDGKIYLLGGFDGGTVSVGGTLDASAPDAGAGGFIDTSGAHVKVAPGAVVSTLASSGATGNWLIDPRDYTIAASGGDITGAQLASNLNNSNVTIATATQGSSGGNGDIFVNDAITKTGAAPTTLTFLAERNINVNQAISSTGGRLNLVATADADNNASGSVLFSANGSLKTNGGNFYAAAMNGNTPLTRGQNVTMADGSFIDVGTGTLGIYVTGSVTLGGASLIASAGQYLTSYYNDGSYNTTPYYGNAITINAGGTGSANRGAIFNGAADRTVANIIGTAGTTLAAGTIGTATAPVTLAALPGTNPNAFGSYQGLTIQNYYGSSYVSEIGTQAFSTLSLSMNNQANSTQSIQLMGDGGGNGSNGSGHVLTTSDGNGVFQVASGGIDTSGVARASNVAAQRPTSVTLSAQNIVFEDNAVNTGTTPSGYGAAFTASGTLRSAAPANGVADINALSVSLNGDAGSAAAPLDVNAINSLSLSNGGSAYLNALGNGPGNIVLTSSRSAGTQSVQFANGDQINVSADGSEQSVGTIGAGSGIDLHKGNRNLTWSQTNGALVLDTNAIDLGSGSLAMYLYNADRANGAAISAVNSKDGNPEITAGNVTLQMVNGTANGISALEIARGAGAGNNTLSIYSNAGSGADIDMSELSADHFKTVSLNLYSPSAQNIHIGLYGADDINLATGATAMTLDATTVNLSAYNRNFQLATNKAVQIDGVAFGTGAYSVNASGRTLALNSDVLTNGGAITLSGSAGISLLRSVRIDSNADDVKHTSNSGNAGMIQLSGPISATAPGYALDVEAASSNGSGGAIYSFNPVGAGSSGAYLSGLRFNADGVNDGYIYLYGGSYLINGDFSSTGRTYFATATTVDTEQGNVGRAGDIRLAGASVQTSGNQALIFDAATGAAGASGGNVDLAAAESLPLLAASSITVAATGGANGAAGNIRLPAVSTVNGQSAGLQSYRGGVISLYGALNSNGGNILLDGDVRLAGTQSTINIDTWNAAPTQSGGAGAVTISGGVSATSAGKSLTIDTSVGTGAAFFNANLDYTVTGGAVALGAGNAGGYYLSGLNINTLASGAHNLGASGALALKGVATTGTQTYAGGVATVSGDLATNGGNINLNALAGVVLAATPISMTTDMAGGSSAAGTINFGNTVLKGQSALTIDTTADGGGAASALTLGPIAPTSSGAALDSLQVTARSITVNGALTSRGDVRLQTTGTTGATGALTLNAAVGSSAGAVVAASAATFVNNAGANALASGPGKTWQVWSTSPGADTLGGLAANYKQYNAVYGTTAVLGSGNGVLYTLAPTISAGLAGTVSKTYDGSTTAQQGELRLTVNGAVAGDTVTLTAPASIRYADANAASAKLVTAEGIAIASASNGAQSVYGYQLASNSASGAVGTIAARSLSVSDIGAATRVYDGSRTVALSGGTLSGLVGSDTLVLGALHGSYADKNVGSAKAVTLDALTLLDGTGLASNYRIGTVNAVDGVVTARALTVAASGIGRVYDGSTAATVTLLDNRVAGDSLTVGASGAAFADKNAGLGKTVSVNGIALGGADAANYTFNTSASTVADITARALLVGASGVNRVYDGSTSATVTLSDNRVAGDSLVLDTDTVSFADKNAGAGKTVTVRGITASGVDAANYSVATSATTSADIAVRALQVDASGINRVYDGSSTAAVTLLDNRVAGDSLTVTAGAAAFADKQAGAAKTVQVDGIAISGADAANYSVNRSASTRADITARALLVSATGVNRVYDGSTGAAVTLLDNRVAGDSLTVGAGSAAFADKNAGAGKTVSVTGIALAGADAANYVVNSTARTSADIAARALLVGAIGVNRVYDGSTIASVTLDDNRVAGDSLTVQSSAAAFADKHAGAGKTVSVNGIALGGADAANYVVNSTTTTSADINARALQVDASGINRVYDGSSTAAVTLLDNRVAGDSLTVTAGPAAFADKQAGAAKTVQVDGIAISGADAANYSVNRSASTRADITARALLVSATGVNRVYDGSTGAAVTLLDNRVAGDSLTVGAGSAAFADKNAGAGKTVSVTGIALGGADAANYVVNSTARTSADIAARALLVGASGVNRVYDGSTSASVILDDNRVAGDQLALHYGAASFADKHAGNGKAVSVADITLSGADAPNYTVNRSAAARADVTPRALAVTASAASRLYSGSSAATVTLLDNRVAGDSLTLSADAAGFADANPGLGKTVTVSGIRVGGPDAANYSANTSVGTRADITSNAALDSAIGAVTNTNVVPTAVTQVVALAGNTRQPQPTAAQSGFLITAPMQQVLPDTLRQGSYVDAVMAPGAGQTGVALTQGALAQLVRPGADGVTRVPLQQNGLASIVNGGVRLPEGVTQQFFIVPAPAAAPQ